MRKKTNKVLLIVIEILVSLFLIISANNVMFSENKTQPVFILLITIIGVLVLITAINIFVIVYKTLTKYFTDD